MSEIHPIIRQIVDRCHVGQSNRAVLRYLVGRLRDGYRTFRAMPKADRRAMMRQAVQCHRANREEYRSVMSGQF